MFASISPIDIGFRYSWRTFLRSPRGSVLCYASNCTVLRLCRKRFMSCCLTLLFLTPISLSTIPLLFFFFFSDAANFSFSCRPLRYHPIFVHLIVKTSNPYKLSFPQPFLSCSLFSHWAFNSSERFRNVGSICTLAIPCTTVWLPPLLLSCQFPFVTFANIQKCSLPNTIWSDPFFVRQYRISLNTNENRKSS